MSMMTMRPSASRTCTPKAPLSTRDLVGPVTGPWRSHSAFICGTFLHSSNDCRCRGIPSPNGGESHFLALWRPLPYHDCMHRASFRVECGATVRLRNAAVTVAPGGRCAGFRAVAVAGVLTAILGTRDATAQSPATSPDSNVSVHDVMVTTSTARFTVSRSPAKLVHLAVQTDSGTFTVSGDSAVLAKWADSAAALPDPPAFVEGEHVSFKVWQLKADGDSGAHMRFARLPTSHGADLTLALSNGVWGAIVYLGPQAPEVLSTLRGDSIALADPAHVKSVVSRAFPRPECRGKDSLAMLPGDPQDPLCAKRHVEKQARQKGGSLGPEYPPALQRAGISGKATLAFIIDTTGRADLKSIRLLSSSDPRFALACREALARMEFVPARVDGHKVISIVELPFIFNVPHYQGIPSPAP